MKASRDFSPENEIVVIGSGPGGSLTAALLAEAGHQVLIMEEGGMDASYAIPPFSREEMTNKYRNGGITMAFGQPRIQYVEGRCAGGGSEINSGLYYRLPEDVRQRWASRWQINDFTRQELEDQAAQVEQDISVSYMPPESMPKPSLLLAEGARNLGWACQEVPRWHRYDIGGLEGERQTMTRTYLARALAAGASLMTGARVLKLRKKKNLWDIDFQYQASDGIVHRQSLLAKTVFIAAGAIQTPVILQNSGLSKIAGNNLQLHPTVKVIAQFPDEVNSSSMGVPVHQIKEFGHDMSMGCSISNPHYLITSMLEKERRGYVYDNWKNLASYYVMITPQGSGKTRKLPFFNDPFVSYKLTNRDMGSLAIGLKRLCQALFAAGATRLFPTINGMGAFETEADLQKIPSLLPRKETSLMTIHLVGTCAMSSNPALAAADSWGKVHGSENLYVNDASLLCEAPGVNPQGAVLAIARRNVQHWLENSGGVL